MITLAAANGRRLFLLATVYLIVSFLVVPFTEASRNLTTSLEPALTPPAMPDLVLEESDAETQPRHRLFGDLSLLERPLGLVAIQKIASGSFALRIQSNIWQTRCLSQNRSGPTFQGLWTDPVTGIAYARNRWYDARTASWLSEDPMGAVDSPNLYAGFGLMPHAVTDPLGEAIRIHIFARHSDLSEQKQQRLSRLIVRYFERLPWAGEADVTIGIVPHSFEDYESLKGGWPFVRHQAYEELAPRAMELDMPRFMEQAAEFFFTHKDLAAKNRSRSKANDFQFHVYAEIVGPSSAVFRQMEDDDPHRGGQTEDGRSIVLEQSFSESVEDWDELLATHGGLLDLLLTSLFTAHELGHQFGLSPMDAKPDFSGKGVMATRHILGGKLVFFLKQLQALASSRGGYNHVSANEVEDLWFRTFEFEGHDADWILHLADPKAAG